MVMEQIYSVKVNGKLALEVNIDPPESIEEVVSWLQEAIYVVSGEFTKCVHCGGNCFKHKDYVCSTCGGRPGLRLVKPDNQPFV